MSWMGAVLAIDVFISLEVAGVMLVLFVSDRKIHFAVWTAAWLCLGAARVLNLISGAQSHEHDFLSYLFVLAFCLLFHASTPGYCGLPATWRSTAAISLMASAIPAVTRVVAGSVETIRSFSIAIAILLWLSAVNFLTSRMLGMTIRILLFVLMVGSGMFYLLTEPLLSLPDGELVWHAVHAVGNVVFSLTLVLEFILRTKAESKEFRERYIKAFRNSHVVMLLLDSDTGAIIEANAAAVDFYGFTEAKLCTMRLGDISQGNAVTMSAFGGEVSGEEARTVRMRHLLRDGRVRDVELVAGPLRVGQNLYLQTIVRDMTDQVQQEKLFAMERELLMLGNRATGEQEYLDETVGIIGRMDILNCCGLYVLSPTEPPAVTEVYTAVASREADDLLRSRELIDRLLMLTRQGGAYGTGDTSVSIQTFRKLSAHGILSIAAEPIADGAGGLIGILLVGSPWRNGLTGPVGNVLESISFGIGFTLRRLRSDMGRSQSEGRWRFALEGIGDLVLEIGEDFSIRYLNENLLPLMGLSLQNAPSGLMDWIPYVHPDDLPILRKTLEEEQGVQGRTYAIEHRMRAQDGTWRWFLHRGLAVEPADSMGTECVLAILSDIHATKMYEAELYEAKSELERANSVKSLFLANISHELRTPMNGINGMIQLLAITSLDPDQTESLEIMKEASTRMMGLIDNLITYTGIEGGTMGMQSGPFAFGDLVSQVMNEYREVAIRKGIHIRIDISPMLQEHVVGDSEKIGMILRQWVDNALKFTDSGTVVIGVKPDLPRGGAQNALPIVVSVTDTGIGIEAGVLPRLFTDFTQADNSYTRVYQGAGLGLAICRKLRDMLGAEFEVESTPGEGSIFRMRVQVERLRGLAAPAEGGSVNGRVLVVDDDEVSRRLLGLFCEKIELEVTYASGGLEAIRLNDEQHFDMIFMDIQMPEISGLEATRRIRERNADRRNPPKIVAVTAYAFRDDKERFLAEGMDDFMAKPIDSGNLFALVRKWMGRRHG